MLPEIRCDTGKAFHKFTSKRAQKKTEKREAKKLGVRKDQKDLK